VSPAGEDVIFQWAERPVNKKEKAMSKQRKFGSRKGATFIEYALLAGLVAIVVAAAAMFFGEDIKKLFSETGDKAKSVSAGVHEVDLSSTLEKAKSDTQNSGGTSNP
jgi:Flp pilus assembly pilin Flp